MSEQQQRQKPDRIPAGIFSEAHDKATDKIRKLIESRRK